MGVVGYGGWKEWSKEKLSGYDMGSEGHRRQRDGHSVVTKNLTVVGPLDGTRVDSV